MSPYIKPPPKPFRCPQCGATRLQTPCEHCTSWLKPFRHPVGYLTPPRCARCHKYGHTRPSYSRKFKCPKNKLPRGWTFLRKSKEILCADCRAIRRLIRS